MKPLEEYSQKRNFKKTPEPGASVRKSRSQKTIFVVQEHHASHLHYDFRLEMDGVLKSWAVPKGPSLDPSIKRLAVEVEDHPVPYADFEGSIPENEYGGGDVYIWDRGTWECEGDPEQALAKGRLEFTLKGKKLQGKWMLLRTRRTSGKSKPQWLLIKRTDEYVKRGDVDIAMVHDHLNPVAEKTNRSKTSKSGRTSSKQSFGSAKQSVGSGKKRTEKTAKAKERKIALSAKSSKATRTNTKKKFENPEVLTFKEPQLALLVEAPPQGEGWIHETKYDGYRTQAHVSGGSVQLLTRSAQDWTHKYPTVARALEKLKVDSVVLDGEIVWIDENGRSDFQKLQNALKEKESTSILYYAFDLMELNNEDLTSLPLVERKRRLDELLSPLKGSAVLYSEHLEGEAEQFLESACDLMLEGIVSKRKDSPYVPGRSDSWVKSKCKQRQEFVIGGFTEGEGSRLGFGALLLGVYEDQKLKYVGKVGTGFNSESLLNLREKLSSQEQKKSPFALRSPREKKTHWVKPELVAEITFANWTEDGYLRVPVFQGLREDKPANQIRRENPSRAPAENGAEIAVAGKTGQGTGEENQKKTTKSQKRSAIEKAVVTENSAAPSITHPEKVLFQKENITKLEVGRYFEAVSQWMLPHLSSRPLSLIRCPSGTQGSCFFQKHASGRLPDSIHRVKIKEKTATREYLSVDSVNGLWALVQQGTLELHGWNCRTSDLAHPDQIVMDLDPGPSVPWKQTVAAAFSLKEKLEKLSLKCFVKVTGGKGIHIHIPIQPLYTWDEIKDWSEDFAREMAEESPELYTTTSVKSARENRIYIDFLRNAQSATAVIPYSLRAREISSVALPLEWSELAKLPSGHAFTLEKALSKIKKRKQDPWKDFLVTAQEIPGLRSPKNKRKAPRSA